MSSAVNDTPARSLTTSRQLVVFALGGGQYALPIESVSEIIRHTEPREVASDVPGVRGVIGLRGKIIPVIDLAARLGLPGNADEGSGRIVIVDADNEGGQAGVMVDAVEEVLTIPSDQIDDAPVAGDAIEGIARVEERLVMLLDVTRALAGVEFAHADA